MLCVVQSKVISAIVRQFLDDNERWLCAVMLTLMLCDYSPCYVLCCRHYYRRLHARSLVTSCRNWPDDARTDNATLLWRCTLAKRARAD